MTTTVDLTVRHQRNPEGANNNNIFGEISMSRIDSRVLATNGSFRSHRHEDVNNSSGRRRASSFNGVEVSKVKSTNENDRVWINHARSAAFSKDNKMDIDNRMAVVSVMKP